MSKQGDKMRYNIKDYLSDKEVDKLMDLFNKIKLDLSDDSFPTRTNRLEAVENMKRFLRYTDIKSLIFHHRSLQSSQTHWTTIRSCRKASLDDRRITGQGYRADL